MNLKNPLADLDQIKASAHLKEATLHHIYRKNQKHKAPVAIGLALACALALIIIPTLQQNSEDITPVLKQYAYISMDINPSIELQVDEADVVSDAYAYNQDGEELLAQLQLKDRPLAQCMQELMANDSFQQYMVGGYLQISIYSENDERSTTLQSTMETLLSHHYTREQYGCHNASNDEYKNAAHHQMSMGCYQMIERILALDDTYAFEDLAELNINELRTIYQECRRSNHDNGYGHGMHRGNR